MKKLDIAIAGAGPAGLAAALFLHRAGHRVTVFERFDTPAPVGSGLILQPTGLTVLGVLGLLDQIMTLGSRIERLYGADARSGRTVLDVRYDAQRGGRFGVAVHRAALFGVLHRAAIGENIAIETGIDLDQVDVGDKVAPITAEGRKVGSFDLVIDASGSRSKLRRFAFHSEEPRPLPYGAFWASLDWRGEGFEDNALLQRYERASVMIGVLPIGRPVLSSEKMAAFFWSLKPDEADRVRSEGLDAWKGRVRGLWPECGAYMDQIDSFDQLTLARYGDHTLKLPVGPRLAIIGDAAHSTSPQLGQGANMAMLDAAALAYNLERAANVDEALDAYARARRWHVRVFQALSSMFTPFYQSDSAMLPFIRDRLVAIAARIPPGPQFLASMVAGTAVDPFGAAGLKESDWSHVVASQS
ncbi:MAG: FAD-dependent monooxygenase [Mesorhizobium sp.]|nr:NAD(P)/FAD-dependent oxidoreductase [Mesorhizobium sp.]MBL8575918.1 FAD-dependent monooxygenase [Mesorhizobium sp.]